MHEGRFIVLEHRPPEVLLAGAEPDALALAGASGLLLGQRVEVIQAADEQQVGDLFDHLQRIGDAARPERIPDPVDIALQLAGDHDPPLSSSGSERNCI